MKTRSVAKQITRVERPVRYAIRLIGSKGAAYEVIPLPPKTSKPTLRVLPKGAEVWVISKQQGLLVEVS